MSASTLKDLLKLPARMSLVLVMAFALSACFRPLYGGLAGRGLAQTLASIEVQPIPKRMGYYLARDLRFALNGTGTPVAPQYKLLVSINQKVQTPLIDTISGRATSASVVLDASYRVLPIGGQQVVTEGVAFTVVSYDRTSQNFANIRAQRDAEIRAAKVLAEQIHVRIASAMAK